MAGIYRLFLSFSPPPRLRQYGLVSTFLRPHRFHISPRYVPYPEYTATQTLTTSQVIPPFKHLFPRSIRSRMFAVAVAYFYATATPEIFIPREQQRIDKAKKAARRSRAALGDARIDAVEAYLHRQV